MSENEPFKITAAESGPKCGDRLLEPYVIEKCACGRPVYFFRLEKYANCFYCGAWIMKPDNGEARH